MEATLEPKAASELIVLNHKGDTKLTWNADNRDEVAAARTMFDELRRKGHYAYKVDRKGDKAEVIRTFDPEAEKVILAPATVGG